MSNWAALPNLNLPVSNLLISSGTTPPVLKRSVAVASAMACAPDSQAAPCRPFGAPRAIATGPCAPSRRCRVAQQVDERIDAILGADDLHDHGIHRHVDDLAAVDVDHLHDLGAVIGVGGGADERHLARHDGLLGDILGARVTSDEFAWLA